MAATRLPRSPARSIWTIAWSGEILSTSPLEHGLAGRFVQDLLPEVAHLFPREHPLASQVIPFVERSEIECVTVLLRPGDGQVCQLEVHDSSQDRTLLRSLQRVQNSLRNALADHARRSRSPEEVSAQEMQAPLEAVAFRRTLDLLLALSEGEPAPLPPLIAKLQKIIDYRELTVYPPSHAPLDLRHWFTSKAQAFGDEAAARGFLPGWSIEAEVPDVIVTDASLVETAFSNLLENVLDHARPGLVTLRLAASGRDHVDLTVADSGPGIPFVQPELVFLPFRKGTPGAPGLGLGLTVAMRCAELLGASLRLEKTDLAGTTFIFSIPKTTKAPASTGQPMLGRRLLLVDDDEFCVALEATLLDRFFAETVASFDAEQAIDQIQYGAFSLIVTDYELGAATGAELARAILELERRLGRRRTPILLMTSLDQHAVRERVPEHASLFFAILNKRNIHQLGEVVDALFRDPRAVSSRSQR